MQDIFTQTYLKIITESQHIRQKIQDVSDSIRKVQHSNKKKESDQAIISTLGYDKFNEINNKLTTIAKDINSEVKLKDEYRYNFATVFVNYLKHGGFESSDILIKRINKRYEKISNRWTEQWNKYIENNKSNQQLDIYLNTNVGKCTRLDYLRAIYKENESLFENITSVNKLLNILYRAALRTKEPRYEYKEGDSIQNVLFNYAPNTIPATGKGQVYLILKYGLILDKGRNIDLSSQRTDIKRYYEVKNILGGTRASLHCELDKNGGFSGLGLDHPDQTSYLLFTSDGLKNISALSIINLLTNYKLCKVRSKRDVPVLNFYPIMEGKEIQTDKEGFVLNLNEIKDNTKPVFRWSTQSHGGIEIYSDLIKTTFG